MGITSQFFYDKIVNAIVCTKLYKKLEMRIRNKLKTSKTLNFEKSVLHYQWLRSFWVLAYGRRLESAMCFPHRGNSACRNLLE